MSYNSVQMKIKKKFYSGAKYKHAIELLIEKGYAVRDPNNPIDWGDGSGFRILYKNFRFEDVNLFITFMNILKEEGCFSDFTNNPYRPAGMEEYSFKNVKIASLEMFLQDNYEQGELDNSSDAHLVLNKNSGSVVYFDKGGREYNYSFKITSMSYALLTYLLSKKGIFCSANSINENLPIPRSDADFVSPERRVSSAMTYIYKCLGLNEPASRFIKRENNSYGIFCSFTYE